MQQMSRIAGDPSEKTVVGFGTYDAESRARCRTKARRKFKCSLDHAKRAFYRAANAIFGKVARAASEEVVLHLVKSKCYPVLLYGLEACVLNNEENRSIDFTTRFLMNLLRTRVCNALQVIADCQTLNSLELNPLVCC